MGQKISGYVEDDLGDLLDDVADHHDIPKTRVVELFLREGVQARDMRLRMVQMEAKLDLLIEGFAEEENAKERIEEHIGEAMAQPIPEGTTGVDLVDEPYPMFQTKGIRPDDWEGRDAAAPSDD